MSSNRAMCHKSRHFFVKSYDTDLLKLNYVLRLERSQSMVQTYKSAQDQCIPFRIVYFSLCILKIYNMVKYQNSGSQKHIYLKQVQCQ